MNKNVKIKLYPTFKQRELLEQHFDGYRFAYNLCLEYKSTMWNQFRINKSGIDMQNELTIIRRETDWLKSCRADCIVPASIDVENTFKKFFKGAGFPRYKSKRDKQSFFAYDNLKVVGAKLKFFSNFFSYKCSIEDIELLNSSKIKKVTFTKDLCGNYFASCLIEFIPSALPKSDNTIGIDLGLKDLAITSDGETLANNKYLRNSHYKLRRLQRKFAKTTKGGSNRNKLRIKIAKLHRKATRQREHTYHQITNKLIRDNQTIVIETLKVKNMMRNHKLARSIQDAGWGLFTTMLDYKCKWYGREFIKIDTFYPSSKTCSGCGKIKETLALSERIYNCDGCGLSIDRDVNAAINIRNAGLKIPKVPMEDAVNRQANEVGSELHSFISK